MQQKTKLYLLSSYLFLVWIIDFIYKLNTSISNQNIDLIKFPKFFFIGLLIYILIIEHKWKTLCLSATLFILIVINAQLLSSQVLLDTSVINHGGNLIFVILLLAVLQTIKPHVNDKINLLRISFELIIFIYIATVIVGVIFQMDVFRTYYTRFGYMGIMGKSITATYLSIISIIYFYFKWQNTLRKRDLILLITVSLVSCLVGTKAILLFICFFSLFIVYKYHLYLNKYLVIGGIALSTIFIMNYQRIIPVDMLNYYINFYNENGLLTILMSYRDEIFMNNSQQYINEWSFYNILFGGKLSSVNLYEMSIFDLISFLGIIGTSVYLFYLFTHLKHQNKSYNYFLCCLFFISIFAGQFFLNNSAITYTFVGLFLITNLYLPPNERIQ